MKYAVEIGLGGMHITNSLTIGSVIQVIISLLPQQTVLEAAMLVLVTIGIYEVSRCDGLRWNDTRAMSYGERFINSNILRLLPQQFERLQCWYC
jgi:hypothetical protein